MKLKHAKSGRVEWIGIRSERKATPLPVDEVIAHPGRGLDGDHYSGGSTGKREVTLIQDEHLKSVAAILGTDIVDPSLTRRNIVVSGLNLLALKDRTFSVGEVILEYTGPCHPCSRMERNLGSGGYNAMRGHGGITARILSGGVIRLGDPVLLSDPIQKP